MNLPSIKTLDRAFPGKGKVLRALLETPECADSHSAVIAWERQCYHRPGLHDRLMCALNAEAGTYGVEYIPHGCGARSPALTYLNTGETYDLTICSVDTWRGTRYFVASWGDIVERGSYE